MSNNGAHKRLQNILVILLEERCRVKVGILEAGVADNGLLESDSFQVLSCREK